jgi:DNA invertase Pin-like site-specific DNA recombinase
VVAFPKTGIFEMLCLMKKQPLRAALYARVSTKDKGQDTENQLAQSRTFCDAQGWSIVHQYVDHVSGKHSDREQFRAMFTAASRREFDCVVSWALDRLSREGVAKTFDHIKTLLGYGVQFISYTEAHFRTTGPAGELMIAIAAWIAQQERVRLSERTLAGLAKARRQGRVGGRPRVICDRSRVERLAKDGKSLVEIAAAVGTSKSTVHRLLMARG